MSIRLDGNIANYLSRTASLPNYNSAYTIMGWFKWKVDTGVTQSTYGLSPANSTNSFDFAGVQSSDLFLVSARVDDLTVQTITGSTATLDHWYHWAAVRTSVTDFKLYVELVEEAAVTLDITGRTAADVLTVGRLTVQGSGFTPQDAEIAYCRVWTTSLTLEEITAERLSHQAVKTASLFGDYPMLDVGTAGNDISGNGNHLTVNGTITAGASEPPLAARPSLFRGRTFSFFDDEEVNRFEFWTAVGGATNLVVQDAAHAHAADNLTLTQVHELAIQSAVHAHTADSVTLTQLHALQVANAAHGHSAENIVLAQVHALVAQDATHAHSVESVVLTQSHSLTVDDATHSHAADSVALTQAHALAVDSATHAHIADSVLLTQAHILVTQSANHAHLAVNVELTQVHELGIDNASHAHIADNVQLDEAVVLVVQDAMHGHAATLPSLTQVHELVVESALHGQAADSLTVGQVHVLTVDDTTHAHGADNTTLVQVHVLAMENASHAHAAENVILDAGVTLVINNSVHGHSAQSLTLIQVHTLIVASATHAHTATGVVVTTQASEIKEPTSVTLLSSGKTGISISAGLLSSSVSVGTTDTGLA